MVSVIVKSYTFLETLRFVYPLCTYTYLQAAKYFRTAVVSTTLLMHYRYKWCNCLCCGDAARRSPRCKLAGKRFLMELQAGQRLGSRRRESLERTGTGGKEDGSTAGAEALEAPRWPGGRSGMNQNEAPKQWALAKKCAQNNCIGFFPRDARDSAAFVVVVSVHPFVCYIRILYQNE